MFYGFLLGFFIGVIVGIMTVTGWLFYWHFEDIKREEREGSD